MDAAALIRMGSFTQSSASSYQPWLRSSRGSLCNPRLRYLCSVLDGPAPKSLTLRRAYEWTNPCEWGCVVNRPVRFRGDAGIYRPRFCSARRLFLTPRADRPAGIASMLCLAHRAPGRRAAFYRWQRSTGFVVSSRRPKRPIDRRTCLDESRNLVFRCCVSRRVEPISPLHRPVAC